MQLLSRTDVPQEEQHCRRSLLPYYSQMFKLCGSSNGKARVDSNCSLTRVQIKQFGVRSSALRNQIEYSNQIQAQGRVIQQHLAKATVVQQIYFMQHSKWLFKQEVSGPKEQPGIPSTNRNFLMKIAMLGGPVLGGTSQFGKEHNVLLNLPVMFFSLILSSLLEYYSTNHATVMFRHVIPYHTKLASWLCGLEEDG